MQFPYLEFIWKSPIKCTFPMLSWDILHLYIPWFYLINYSYNNGSLINGVHDSNKPNFITGLLELKWSALKPSLFCSCVHCIRNKKIFTLAEEYKLITKCYNIINFAFMFILFFEYDLARQSFVFQLQYSCAQLSSQMSGYHALVKFELVKTINRL